MFATALIVFREVLEAALIVGIVAAACRGLAGRATWIAAGIGAGLLGSGIVALFASVISDAAAGFGQEYLNAGILLLAVMMLGWHSVWMSRHGRELAQHAGELGRSVSSGELPLYAVTIAIATAVLREGSETVLFLAGIASSDGDGASAMLIGGLLGAAAGAAVGALLYAGLLRIPLRYFFTATNVLVLLLAAGMAAQATGFLVQADALPPLVDPLWDASGWLSEGSLAGKILHSLIGYESRPAGIQVLAYAATILTILAASRLARQADKAAAVSGASSGGSYAKR